MTDKSGNPETPTEFHENSSQENEEVNPTAREDEILGGTKALLTILKLSIGPFFSQVTNSLYGFINTIWLRNAVSELATTALASSTTIDSLTMNCGFYLSTCCSSKIAALFGEHRGELASQIVVDLLRISVLFGIVLPAILIPVSEPLITWIGASDEVYALCREYLIPITSGAVITCMYLMLCGCLQAEGRTHLFAIAQVSALILHSGVFSPIFLLGIKTGIMGSSLALICAQFISGLVIFICFFAGKFTTKPKFGMFLNKFSPETWPTLKIGLPSLVGAVSATLPSIFFQKFIGSSCGSEYEFNIMMSMYNSYNRIYQIMIALYQAVTSGFLPAASFAFAANRPRRVLFLLMHTTWIVVALSFIIIFIMFVFPDAISSLFSSDPFFKERFKACLLPYWTTSTFCSLQYVATPLMQSTNHPIWAFVGSFITLLLMWPACSCLFYFTDKHNVIRLFYAVMSNDLLSCAILTPFCVLTLKPMVCPSKEQGETEEQNDNKESHENENTDDNSSIPAEL